MKHHSLDMGSASKLSVGSPAERHRPEQTTLYRLVQEHAATFFAQTEAADGSLVAWRPRTGG